MFEDRCLILYLLPDNYDLGKKVGCIKGELAMDCWALDTFQEKEHREVEAYLPQYLLNTVVQVLGNTPMQPLGG